MNTNNQPRHSVDLAEAFDRAGPVTGPSIDELQHQVEVLTTGLTVIIDLATNRPGADVFVQAALEALAALNLPGKPARGAA